jgi:hypothetical protein
LSCPSVVWISSFSVSKFSDTTEVIISETIDTVIITWFSNAIIFIDKSSIFRSSFFFSYFGCLWSLCFFGILSFLGIFSIISSFCFSSSLSLFFSFSFVGLWSCVWISFYFSVGGFIKSWILFWILISNNRIIKSNFWSISHSSSYKFVKRSISGSNSLTSNFSSILHFR